VVLHPRLRMLFKSEFLGVPILGRVHGWRDSSRWSVATRSNLNGRWSRRRSRSLEASRSSCSPRARGAGPARCSRSRRAASSWPSRPRCRWCRSP
jgi:hypothetical protein